MRNVLFFSLKTIALNEVLKDAEQLVGTPSAVTACCRKQEGEESHCLLCWVAMICGPGGVLRSLTLRQLRPTSTSDLHES